ILDNIGTSIGTIQRILGHQNRRTTEIYLHSVGDAERKAMDKLQEDDIFSNGFSINPEAPTNMPMSFWQRKIERPTYDVLKSEIGKLGYSGVGRKYNVSDNTIRKWLRSYGEKSCLR
ncbi:MAG: hypothetical protein JRI62_07070, partial [Deltaproteobacteria bacterium]|nr:hypothetical protein [Deltaproteobacteria bacterium]